MEVSGLLLDRLEPRRLEPRRLEPRRLETRRLETHRLETHRLEARRLEAHGSVPERLVVGRAPRDGSGVDRVRPDEVVLDEVGGRRLNGRGSRRRDLVDGGLRLAQQRLRLALDLRQRLPDSRPRVRLQVLHVPVDPDGQLGQLVGGALARRAHVLRRLELRCGEPGRELGEDAVELLLVPRHRVLDALRCARRSSLTLGRGGLDAFHRGGRRLRHPGFGIGRGGLDPLGRRRDARLRIGRGGLDPLGRRYDTRLGVGRGILDQLGGRCRAAFCARTKLGERGFESRQ